MEPNMPKDSLPITRFDFLQEINTIHKEIELLKEKINERTFTLDKKTNETAVELNSTKFRLNNLEGSIVNPLTFKEEVKKIMNLIDTISKKLETLDKTMLGFENKLQGMNVSIKKAENSILDMQKVMTGEIEKNNMHFKNEEKITHN
jgi:uncharacterized coiled-coil DUF342 family protein